MKISQALKDILEQLEMSMEYRLHNVGFTEFHQEATNTENELGAVKQAIRLLETELPDLQELPENEEVIVTNSDIFNLQREGEVRLKSNHNDYIVLSFFDSPLELEGEFNDNITGKIVSISRKEMCELRKDVLRKKMPRMHTKKQTRKSIENKK